VVNQVAARVVAVGATRAAARKVAARKVAGLKAEGLRAAAVAAATARGLLTDRGELNHELAFSPFETVRHRGREIRISNCFHIAKTNLSFTLVGTRIANKPNAVEKVFRMADYKTERGFFASK